MALAAVAAGLHERGGTVSRIATVSHPRARPGDWSHGSLVTRLTPPNVGKRLLPFALAVAACAGGRTELEEPVGATHAKTPRPGPDPRRAERAEPSEVEQEPSERRPRSSGEPRCPLPDVPAEAPRFSTDDFWLRPRAITILADLARCLRRTGQSIVVVGHADPRGGERYNVGLGLQRAKAVRRFLVKRGVPAERIAVDSCGEALAVGVAPESRARDRYVAIHPAETWRHGCQSSPWALGK